MPKQGALPRVSLILAIRNEERHIRRCVESVLGQAYPADRLEVIVVDGESTDATVAEVRRADPHGRVRYMRNPRRAMPFALNQALDVATGEYVGSVIGHSTIPHDYVRRCVETMERTGAWAVGGRYVRRGETATQRAIAAVTSHPFGVGDARHNFSSEAGWAETAFPGFWRREVFEQVGRFDPEMVVNEDNELSLRIRKAGGRIWYEPSIGVDYYPRDSFGAFFHQYRWYAKGKVAVFRKHRAGLSWRHIVPTVWVVWLAGGAVVSVLFRPLAAAWVLGCASYLVVLGGATVRIRRTANTGPRIVAALMTIHAAYGVGFLEGWATWISDAIKITAPRSDS